MPITDFLEKNARLHPDEVALVEVNPANQPDKNLTWHEYNLIEATVGEKYRCEITWREFDIAAKSLSPYSKEHGIAWKGEIDYIEHKN